MVLSLEISTMLNIKAVIIKGDSNSVLDAYHTLDEKSTSAQFIHLYVEQVEFKFFQTVQTDYFSNLS
jgi:hypothetical protein